MHAGNGYRLSEKGLKLCKLLFEQKFHPSKNNNYPLVVSLRSANQGTNYDPYGQFNDDIMHEYPEDDLFTVPPETSAFTSSSSSSRSPMKYPIPSDIEVQEIREKRLRHYQSKSQETNTKHVSEMDEINALAKELVEETGMDFEEAMKVILDSCSKNTDL